MSKHIFRQVLTNIIFLLKLQKMHFLLLLTPFVLIATSEIIDYSNHEFFLFKNKKDVLTYESYANLFHITNLHFHKEIIDLESGYK